VARRAFAFQQTAVIPAFPAIQHDLGASEQWTAWLLSGYLVLASVATPLVGKLADRHGKRRLLAIALAVFLVGSVGAALSPSIWFLIVFRALQGIGGSVFPLSYAIARDEVPEGGVAASIGVLTGAFGLGTALGFGVSGAVVVTLSWRYLFWIGAFAILCALAAVWIVPRSHDRAEASLDGLGAALLGGGLGLALIGLTEAPISGFGAARAWGPLAAGVALLAWWLRHELHEDEPLLDLSVLARRDVLLANLATLLLGYALFSVYFLVPYLRSGAGAVSTGLVMLSSALGQLAAGPLSGPLARRFGPKPPFAGGMALVTLGCAGLAVRHGQAIELVVFLALLGIGIGLAVSVGTTIVAAAVPETQSAIATSLNAVLRRAAGGVGAQVAALLFAVLAAKGGGPSSTAFAVAFALTAGAAFLGTLGAAAVRPRET
jgi:MFS family permease